MKNKKLISIVLLTLTFIFAGLAAFLAWSINTRSTGLTETQAAIDCTVLRDDTYNGCFATCKAGNKDCQQVLDSTYNSCYGSCKSGNKNCTDVLNSTYESCNSKCLAGGIKTAGQCAGECGTTAREAESSCKSSNKTDGQCAGECGNKAREAQTSCNSSNKTDGQCAGECGDKARAVEESCKAGTLPPSPYDSLPQCSKVSDGTGPGNGSADSSCSSSSSLRFSTNCKYSDGTNTKAAYCCPKGQSIETYTNAEPRCVSISTNIASCGTNTTLYAFGDNNNVEARVKVVNCSSSEKSYSITRKYFRCNSAGGTSNGECSETLVSNTTRSLTISPNRFINSDTNCEPGSCGSCQADISAEGATDGIFKSSGVDCPAGGGGGGGPTGVVTATPAGTTSCNSISISNPTISSGQNVIVSMVVNNPSTQAGDLVVYNKDTTCNGGPCLANIPPVDADRNANNQPINSGLVALNPGQGVKFVTPSSTNTFQWSISYKQLFGSASSPVIDASTGKALTSVQLNGLGGGMNSFDPKCVTYLTVAQPATISPSATTSATVTVSPSATTSATVTNSVSATTTVSTITTTSFVTTSTNNAGGNLPRTGILENTFWTFGIGFILLAFAISLRRRMHSFEDDIVKD